jgi:23S rRNA A2030 N6-methylase RlmJ
MLSRQDLTSPSRQDKNAGNSGDLVKHTAYLAMLDELVRSGRKAHVVEAHGGKGVYVSSNPHLRKAQQAAQYSTSALGRAQAECFAPAPDGLGVVSDLANAEIAYAGSGALHASAVANGLADSLELLDSDAGVRSVADRVFSEDCFRRCAAISERLILPGRRSRWCCRA